MVAPLRPDPRVFAALADATRLSIVERLQDERACSTTRLAAGTGLSRQAVRKHLGVLADAGLVRDHRQGRERLWALDARPLRAVSVWAASYERMWEERLDRLDALLAATSTKTGEST